MIGVVCGSFHKDEVSRMLDTVKATIDDQGLARFLGALMEPVWVPGAFEVRWPPSACWTQDAWAS